MRVPAFVVALCAALAAVVALASARGSRASPEVACARALAVAAPTASATIQISEVEADPVLGGTDTPNEWFELSNVGSSTLTLANWTVSDSTASDALPTVTIAAGHCVVVAATSDGFLAEHAGYTQAFLTVADGAIGNGLSNSGDVVTLRDANGGVVDCVGWGSGTGCFAPAVAATAANTSATLQRTSGVDTDTAADWAAAAETPCAGPATAVRVARLRAVRVGRHAVRLTWRALATEDVAAFRVWRGARGLVRVSPLIPASGRGSYRFVDRRVPRAAGAVYRLQAIYLDGRREWAGSARAA